MNAVGIVAEYNPFHNGHEYHIAEAKRILGCEFAVVVMSASFVQRGEPAVADKFIRTRWALNGGADIVIELPDVFALSCAERFASGAVRILGKTGIVDSICFGSESADIAALRRLADADMSSPAIADMLSTGTSYPRAVAEALGVRPGPNDILGAEYIRAVERHAPQLGVHAIKRTDGGYNSDALSEGFASAKAIRNALAQCSAGMRLGSTTLDLLGSSMPRYVMDDITQLIKRGAFPASDIDLSDAVLYKLRCSSNGEIAELPEVAEGLENLLLLHSTQCSEYAELLSRVKSKRYTMARLKRICMNMLIGVTAEVQNMAFADDSALYARVLGMRKGADGLISSLCKMASIPVILRAKDREQLSKNASIVEKISSRAHIVRALGQPYEKVCAADVSEKLIVI